MKFVVPADDLELLDLPAGAEGGTIRYFRGDTYGVRLSLLCVEIQPGHGARLHTHTYDELFVIHEGRGRYVIGGETLEAGPGDVVVIPAGLPHRFTSIGSEPLRQTSVHGSPIFARTVLAPEDDQS